MDRTSPIAGGVVVVIEEVRRVAGRVHHDGVIGVVILVREHAAEELRAAVEVQRTAGERGEIIGLDGVGESSAEAHGPFVQHELAAEGIGADGRETDNRRGRRIDDEGTRTRLDEGNSPVRGAVTAVHRGVNRQLGRTNRPDIEGRGGVDLIKHATGNDGGAAIAHKDTTRGEPEAHAVREGDVRTAFDRQRVRREVRADRRDGIEGELEIIVIQARRNVRCGILAGTERTDDTVVGKSSTAAAGVGDSGEGITLLVADLISPSDNGPGEDTLGGGTITTALADEGDAAREDDVGISRVVRDTEIIAAEEHRSALRTGVGVLGRRDRVVRRGRKHEVQPVGDVDLQGDGRGATTEQSTIRPFGDGVRGGIAASDVKFAAAEDDVAGVDRAASKSSVGRDIVEAVEDNRAVVQDEATTLIEVRRSGQGAAGEELQVRTEGRGEVRRDGEGVVRGINRGDDRTGRHAGAGDK